MPVLPTIHNSSTGAKRHSTEYQDSRRRQAGRQFRTNSTTWRKMRSAQLTREPLCRECRKQGRIKSARVCDHIDGDSNNNSIDNYQSLCINCHNRKTAKFDGGFGRKNN